MRLPYNLCFIMREPNEVLLVNRNKMPLMGLWNGVGGKLEPGETPYASALREIEEETGLPVAGLRFGGMVTWETDGNRTGGMYVYIGQLACGSPAEPYPRITDEGILAWKPIEWAVDPDNRGVAGHLRHFLPPMLASVSALEHRCVFKDGQLLGCSMHPIHEPLPPGTLA